MSRRRNRCPDVIVQLLMIALAFKLLPPVSPAAFSPLYTTSDEGIVILDNGNFTSHLSGRSNAFLVEFYNTWCGHCVKFAPIFKQFAMDVIKWSPVVQLAVVDCAEDRNHDICREYEIYMYPSLRFFPPKYSPLRDYSLPEKPQDYKPDVNRTGEPYDGLIDASESIQKTLIDMIHNSGPHEGWPNLTAVSVSSKMSLIRSLPLSKTASILALIESHDSLIASQLILDLSMHQNELILTRVQENNTQLVNELTRLKYFPQLIEIRRHDYSVVHVCCSNETVEKDKDLRRTLYTVVKDKFLPHIDSRPLTRPEVKVISGSGQGHVGQVKRPDNSLHKSGTGDGVKSLDFPVHEQDLYNALRYSIFNQITMHQTLNSSQLQAFKSFLRIVDEYFPFDDHDSRPGSFIKLLSKWSSSKSHTLSTDELLSEMSQFEEDYSLPDMKPYKSCQGSSSRFRGYPCSLWLLFHCMTVNEYNKHSSIISRSGADAAVTETLPHEVLPVMRLFILNFFGCTDCAKHFASESEGVEDSLTSLNSSVLWLWRTHNRVNKRLSGENSEDPEHPKLQFPPPHICADCYFPNNSFNEGKVFEFLVRRYHSNNIVRVRINTGIHLKNRSSGHKIIQHRIQHEHDHDHVNPDSDIRFVSSYYSLLNRTDITIFVVLYVFSVTLLVGLFIFFRMRGKRKKYPHHHYQISNPNLRYPA